MLFLEDGVPVKNRTYHFRTYEECFGNEFPVLLLTFLVGSELVDWLVKYHVNTKPEFSRADAVKFGQAMLEKGLFAHVVSDHNFKDDYLFYRFQVDMSELMEAEGNEVPKKNLEELLSSMKDTNTGIKMEQFKGNDLCNWVVSKLSVDEVSAIAIIEQLVAANLLRADSPKYNEQQLYSYL